MKKYLASAAAVFIFTTSMLGASYARDVKSIAILTPEQGTDYGWNQQGIEGAKAAAKKAGAKIEIAQGLGYGDIRSTLRELAGDGVDLMIAHASGYTTAAREIAKETNTPVAVVDSASAADQKGLIADYTLSGHQGAYLAGRLAAKMTRTKKIGIVVSSESPEWNSQSAAFAQGVHDENKDDKVIYSVIGPAAYSDAAGAKRVSESVIAAGADIIFGQGDGATFGMLQAVETTKAADGGKVYFIDVIGDKEPIDKGYLLSSVVWNLEPVFYHMIQDLKAGTFGTKHYSIELKDDSVKLLKTPQIPDNVWKEMQALREDVISGKIKVEPVFDANAVHALMSQVNK